MTFKFIYDMPYVKNIIHYVLIPILVLIVVGLIITFIYSKKCKDHTDYKYQFKMNVLVIIFSMLVIAFFLAVLLGYALALRNYMEIYDFNSKICYLVLISPIIPAIFLIYLIVRLVKITNEYENEKEEKEEEEKERTNVANLTSIDNVVIPEIAVDYKEPETTPNIKIEQVEEKNETPEKIESLTEDQKEDEIEKL